MKIRKLSIKEHKHLKDLVFDFTYPEGHAKYGQPLEKVCIMGQSATGKTSVIQMIRENVSALRDVELVDGSGIFRDRFPNINGKIEYDYIGRPLSVEGTDIVFIGQRYKFTNSGGNITQLLPKGLKLLYFGAEMVSSGVVNILNRNPLELQNEEFGNMKNVSNSPKLIDYDLEFSEEVNVPLWFSLLNKILAFRKQFTQLVSEMLHKGKIADFQKLSREYEDWAQKNENPLQPFAQYFNPVLEKLNLEVDLVSTEYAIPIKSKITDETVSISALSTGTKGLLLSLFPLFTLDTKDAMILVDEPERSLFPDMQIELIAHYRNISPDSQLIVATHSPFIAAAFEPEERFILYFDNKGKVAVRRGESPRGDDPNDILANDFNVDYYNEFGKQAYKRYLDLKQEIVAEQDAGAKRKLIVERAELGDKYNFE